MTDSPNRWNDAMLAAAMITIDPSGLSGVHLRARSGPVRDRWLKNLAALQPAEAAHRRIAAGISPARLSGGLDLAGTLAAGKPVLEQGVLAAADGGIVVLAMAERLEPAAAGVIASALDNGEVRIERDGLSATQAARFVLIALDEGIDDEVLDPALADRLGLRIDLNAVGWREIDATFDRGTIERASGILPDMSIPDAMTEALCAVALAAGVVSMRAPLHLIRAARLAAAMRGSATVETEDARTALRLVLGMESAVAQEPGEVEREEPEQDRPEQHDSSADDREHKDADASDDMLVEAVDAVLPRHLLAGLQMGAQRQRGATAGKAGAVQNRARRGRAVGVVDRPPTSGARPDVLATLRQAAPWQRIRAREEKVEGGSPARRLHIRKSDFRYVRYQDKTGTTAIFAVDASGSAAYERLAETKGAVELLLAECYVRRDSVALVSFRGKIAEVLLEPTRSLTRAKRNLSSLPGGGGTPLAGGIVAALGLATAARSKGQSVVAVFLTDGRGNVALDGTSDRDHVSADTTKAARLFRVSGVRSILIDTARRPQPRAQALAAELGAEYLPLPRGGSAALAREVGARMEA